ncbi:extracellular solute-binding protein [Cohnella terricola]|uniref:Extracellular solute-binding protein n=1 Tax=Cohnella terricola TaxID=1289167 RepID=A0A559JWB9_9BACL|nr:extracellular solute-binding protein [Cohnella terricola]TVY04176.1 extracellular solute-binding protein [Cohnella terricola]
MKKMLAISMTLLMGTSLITGCSKTDSRPEGSKSAQEQLDQVTLKIMIPGDRPKDFDAVIAEAEKRLAPTLNVKLNVVFVPWSDLAQKTQVTLASGEAVDLVFDAPWLHLNQMVAANYYAPLDDLLKQYGPDILKARSEQLWEANKYNGQIMAIPLSNAYLAGHVYYVRKDLREKLGVAPIKTYDDLIKFAEQVKEKVPDISPIISYKAVTDWTNFRTFFDYDSHLNETAIGVNGVLYLKDNDGKVHNMFEEMDSTVWKWITDARYLYQNKLMYQDVMSVKDQMEVFKSGKAAIINAADFGVKTDVANALKKNVPGAEVEAVTFFKLEKEANLSSFQAWNFIALSQVSKNKERAIQFLNWTQQKDNYDLLAYGIKGTNWEPIGENQYKVLNDGYAWFPYAWIWNPTLDRYDQGLGEEAQALNQFVADADNFTPSKLTGFTFDSAPVANEIAQLNTLRDKYMDAIYLGIVDPETYWNKYKSEASSAAKKIQVEMQKQIDAFLASKN